ncbi:MAG: flagellar biosynthesis anti-sigma factor FlgM [Phycisphaerales bacterium]
MSEISPIGGLSHAAAPANVGRGEPTARTRPLDAPIRRDADRVEVSREARAAQRAEQPAANARIDQIRREIADGTYDTPERLGLAADSLIFREFDARGPQAR